MAPIETRPETSLPSSERRRRVLWLAKGLGPGGMERLLVTHAELGDRDRFDYSAAYLVERPHSVVPALEALGVPCRKLGDGRGADPRWVGRLRSLIRRERIDVVHAHSPLMAALARPALRAMSQRPALVYTEHNSWDCYGVTTRLANAITYPLDDAQLAVSAAAASSPPGPLARGVEVLTHGIDLGAVAEHARNRGSTRAALGFADVDVVVLTVAHLRHEKGYDVLLDAAARAAGQSERLRFLCVGHGPLADELAARRDALGLQDRVTFLGFRDDVADLLSAADIVCFASRNEGLPVALMEAYAAGRPVVGTRVGGLPDVIEDGVSGRLVDPEAPDALAAALVELATDPALRAAMGRRSAELASRFDATAAVRRIEAIYDTVASEGPRR